MKFKWWYILIWIAGIVLIANGQIETVIIGIITLAVPFVLWFAVKPKQKEEKHIELSDIVPPVDEDRKPHIEKVRIAVINAEKYQKTLEKVYKMQEGDTDIWDMPQCVLYPRGNFENIGYAVYLDSDRIGDADENKCVEIRDLLGQGELCGLDYEIRSEYMDDIDGLYFDAVVTLSVKIP